MSIEQTVYNSRGALATLAQQGALLKRHLRESIPIESRRVALERMITVEVPHHGAFFGEYSANISMTGMFIQTDRVQAPGTLVKLEFSLADGGDAVTGEAEVVWVRKRSESPDLPAGMGLKFRHLDEEGRAQIRQMVEKRLPTNGGQSTSGKPSAEEARSESEAGSVAEAPLVRRSIEDDAGSRLRSQTEIAVAGSGRGRWQWLAYLVLVGLLAGALFYLYQEPFQRRQAVPAEQPAPPAADRPAANPGAPDLEPLAPVLDTVAAWAAAWSAQRSEDYLSFYAQTYRPPGNLGLAEWRHMRRERIARPARIEVEITDLEADLLNPERARVRFQQSYVSDTYSDRVRKILELVLEDGQWKIEVERAD